jgi:hypothetical protein
MQLCFEADKNDVGEGYLLWSEKVSGRQVSLSPSTIVSGTIQISSILKILIFSEPLQFNVNVNVNVNLNDH